jgi:hypothetical protein
MKNNIAWETIQSWIISNILWSIVWLLFIAIFVRFFPSIFRAFKVSRAIIKKNRETLGNGYGKHVADRFINIWYSNQKNLLHYKEIRHICIAVNNGNIESRREENDDELMALGLIGINDLSGQKLVYPILNWQNRIVSMLVEFYLIYFIGDDPNYYKNLKERSKK